MGTAMAEEGQDTSLVARARAGDRTAFDGLCRKLGDRLRAFVVSRIPASHRGRLDADEILQDALVRAFGSIGSFRGQSVDEFRRWLAGVAAKTVLRHEEETRRHLTLEIGSGVAAKGVSPSKALRREERFDRLEGAFNSLSGDYREVVHLTRIQGLTIKEAAARMGRSPEATKKLFWRALRQLRKTMTDTASLSLPSRDLRWEGEGGGGPSPEGAGGPDGKGGAGDGGQTEGSGHGEG